MAPPRRRIRLLLVYAAVTLPAVILGASAALRSNANSPLDWVTSEFPARREYEEFTRDFGPGDLVVASWDGNAPVCKVLFVAADHVELHSRNSHHPNIVLPPNTDAEIFAVVGVVRQMRRHVRPR